MVSVRLIKPKRLISNLNIFGVGWLVCYDWIQRRERLQIKLYISEESLYHSQVQSTIFLLNY